MTTRQIAQAVIRAEQDVQSGKTVVSVRDRAMQLLQLRARRLFGLEQALKVRRQVTQYMQQNKIENRVYQPTKRGGWRVVEREDGPPIMVWENEKTC